ncbi:MAG: GNAT family N-acetyltransferase [Thermobispora bispora]|jgi:GNAT superfamily N-acetyltransferase|uniref:GCN5-related N-acetyltransferase n=1 Tax=Thermobispora bispora (strain ATCC 19993 / DSM 43833 / CBS 139.67 / JCM 10125 / KCTC 9307 / NBRC 14880 / R51) TaxID=469371 RepID=D6Y7X5_THEBD|nr:GNAT family N-acetyltransferase [Thermobispora bispora]MBO2473679.1 N-acetyltransferase [Actinomycetales bacterium]MDI9581071.1 GNAT family N-acetyltransferase [Thermobispora sp.]ADG87794.1 GCN5-related N-acetyltransferase [Thermobispora bispora DSM 43833]MBX6167466.1 GNAT family N-acetyltransferase [Thermobispora bispora]QSI47694.1 GNAT family N-acetyltransferase [Thermobispora bispora]
MGVRPARPEDVDAVTSTQIRAWKYAYREFLPPGPLEQMTGPAAEKMWRRQWEEAILSPPTPRHRVLVAVERVVPDTDAFTALGPGGRVYVPPAAERATDRVVGIASHGPAEDPDLSSSTTAELLTLLVDPNHIRRGHGSRLLNATVDYLREDGYSMVVTWVFADNYPMLSFLESAGWGEDEAERVLDMGRPIRMIRLCTDIS